MYFYDIGFPGSKTAAIFKIILLVKTFEWHSIYDKLGLPKKDATSSTTMVELFANFFFFFFFFF